jgi:hypothetical protein
MRSLSELLCFHVFELNSVIQLVEQSWGGGGLTKYPYYRGLINYIDTKAKCRHLKSVKGLCSRPEFLSWRYIQSC